MGYGIVSGTDTVWVSLPFIGREKGDIAESGFGSNNGDDTADYAVDVIEEICNQWGGDRNKLFLCGFSRGAIACGYIGLRNDKIASYWKGFVACQHSDASSWRQSRMEDAKIRAPRFKLQRQTRRTIPKRSRIHRFTVKNRTQRTLAPHVTLSFLSQRFSHQGASFR
jgi:hypothetical protein